MGLMNCIGLCNGDWCIFCLFFIDFLDVGVDESVIFGGRDFM